MTVNCSVLVISNTASINFMNLPTHKTTTPKSPLLKKRRLLKPPTRLIRINIIHIKLIMFHFISPAGTYCIGIIGPCDESQGGSLKSYSSDDDTQVCRTSAHVRQPERYCDDHCEVPRRHPIRQLREQPISPRRSRCDQSFLSVGRGRLWIRWER